MPNKLPPKPQKGERWGGRQKGTPNKATVIGRDRLAQYSGEAIELLVAIMRNDLKCGVCGGTGKSKYQAGDKSKTRDCTSCYKSGRERIDPKTRMEACKEIVSRSIPTLKAIEHSGADDKPPVRVVVEYVD